MIPSSRAWRGHFFDSLVDSTLTLTPGFGPANVDQSLAHLLSLGGLDPCCLPKDIRLCLPGAKAIILKLYLKL